MHSNDMFDIIGDTKNNIEYNPNDITTLAKKIVEKSFSSASFF